MSADAENAKARDALVRSPHLLPGLVAAALTFAVDQAFKLWMLFVVDIAARGVIPVLPVLDLVMAWNYGVSFGLFQQDDPIGQWALVAFKAVVVVFIGWWMLRAETRLTGVALGLIVGGALGNGLDRILYGAVADFFAFHLELPSFTFRWYVFNLADVAIVAGVALLLYEAVFGTGAGASKST